MRWLIALAVATGLLFVSCHYEEDGSPLCPDEFCMDDR
jgi:hypothetical protein